MSQASIALANPSFEGFPSGSMTPAGWINCKPEDQSPPDIQPGAFRNFTAATHGKTYLGLVVRSNETYEEVSQALVNPMMDGACYDFSLSLLKADHYWSRGRNSDPEEVNYQTPAVLKIWGGNGNCSHQELLWESPPVGHNSWKQYNIKLKPKRKYSHISLQADFRRPTLYAYNGNICVDGLSTLQFNSKCSEKQVKADPIVEKPKPKTKNNPVDSPNEIAETTKKFKSAVRGQVIKLENLYFAENSSLISNESYSSLDELFNYLQANQKVQIEIGGHTNGVPSDKFCDSLSTVRAQEVYTYLVKKGINSSRLTYKGYGKRNPVSDNKTKEGRAKNQRVEIKFLTPG
jgi:outer membrane protein OmpA-like peptidoglycan-associated protein